MALIEIQEVSREDALKLVKEDGQKLKLLPDYQEDKEVVLEALKCPSSDSLDVFIGLSNKLIQEFVENLVWDKSKSNEDNLGRIIEYLEACVSKKDS